MKLEKKLFLSISSLFVIVALVSFILPYYFSKENIAQSENNILSVFGKEIRDRASKDLKVLNKALESAESKEKSSLIFYDRIARSLHSESKSLDWTELAFFLEHNKYEVDFVQKLKGDKQQISYVIDPYLLEPIYRKEIWKSGPCWIINRMGDAYIGLPYINPELVDDLQGAGNVSISELHSNVEDKYILFKKDKLLRFIENYGDQESYQIGAKDIDKLKRYLKNQASPIEDEELSGFIDKSIPCRTCERLSKILGNDDLIEWTRSSAITLLDFLSSEYGKLGPYEETLVEGIACFFPEGLYEVEGDIGLFYSSESLYPKSNEFRIYDSESLNKEKQISESVLIDNSQKPITFFGQKTIAKDGSTLIMGKNVKSIIRELYLDSNEMLFISHKGNMLNGYDYTGLRIKKDRLDTFNAQLYMESDVGVIRVDDEVYTYSQYHLDQVYDGINIFIVRGINKQVVLFKDILSDFYTLLKNLGWQLFTVVVTAIVIALILLHFISKRVTRSLVALAGAAEKIGHDGGYDHLPPMIKGNDEVAVLSRSFHYMVDSMKVKEKIRSVLDKVVSKTIADQILSHPIDIGGEERYCSILFIDIRDFTHYSEGAKASDVVDYLNEFMSKMTRAIEDHHGVVDKFIGDGIMALFGAPLVRQDHADCALAAAIDMIKALKSWNIEREKEGKKVLYAGIGLHTASVIAGNMGSKERLNYTVIGKGVNLAARLCDAAGPMEIILSEDTYRSIKNSDGIKVEECEGISLKGVSHIPKLYNIK